MQGENGEGERPLSSSSTGKRIVIAEDEPSIARLVQTNLERAGYQVEVAYNGVEALEMILKDQPALLISDIMMPEMDGIELLNHLRKDPVTRDLPVVMLTQKSEERDVLFGYARGADVYLNKPFVPAHLLQVVAGILSEETPKAEE